MSWIVDGILKGLAAFVATPFPAICLALGVLCFLLLKRIDHLHKDHNEKILALTTTVIKHTERQGLVMEEALSVLERFPVKKPKPQLAPPP